jgi:hypothetical protein
MSPPPNRKWLLVDVVLLDPLNASQQQEFNRLMNTDAYAATRSMLTARLEERVEEARNEASVDRKREALRWILERRFGVLTADAIPTIASWCAQHLDETLQKCLDAKSLAELGLSDNVAN